MGKTSLMSLALTLLEDVPENALLSGCAPIHKRMQQFQTKKKALELLSTVMPMISKCWAPIYDLRDWG